MCPLLSNLPMSHMQSNVQPMHRVWHWLLSIIKRIKLHSMLLINPELLHVHSFWSKMHSMWSRLLASRKSRLWAVCDDKPVLNVFPDNEEVFQLYGRLLLIFRQVQLSNMPISHSELYNLLKFYELHLVRLKLSAKFWIHLLTLLINQSMPNLQPDF
jgi:hypothetical protein